MKKKLISITLILMALQGVLSNLFRGGVRINGREERIHQTLQEGDALQKREKHMTELDKKIRDMEKEIEERKRKKSLEHIKNLEKNLSKVKIYKPKETILEPKTEVVNKAFYYLRHNNKALKVQA